MNKIFETPLYPYYQSVDQTASAPAHHSVVVIGAGPVGLGMAIDLAQHGIDVVVLDDNDKVSFGSRAICLQNALWKLQIVWDLATNWSTKGSMEPWQSVL